MFVKDISDIHLDPDQPSANEATYPTDYIDAIKLKRPYAGMGQDQNDGSESKSESENDDLPTLARMKDFFRASERRNPFRCYSTTSECNVFRLYLETSSQQPHFVLCCCFQISIISPRVIGLIRVDIAVMQSMSRVSTKSSSAL